LAVGSGNAKLLRLYCAVFGAALPCRSTCPECGVAVELELNVENLLARGATEVATGREVTIGDWQVSFRPPNEDDLDAVLAEPDLESAQDKLLGRCVTSCRHRSESSHVSSLPADVVAQVNVEMEECDPLAVLEFELRCPECKEAWGSHLDVGAFLWAKLDAGVRRLVRDVHVIASAYGWDERTIMAMSSARRQLYLELAAE
jgi:hypothetical protein